MFHFHSLAQTARLLLLSLILLLPARAVAWEFSIKKKAFNLQGTNTFKYTYHYYNHNMQDVDDWLHQFLNTLDASISHDVFRAGARFDLNLFADTYFDRECEGAASDPTACSQSDRRYVQTFSPQRFYFTVARPELDLTLGDFYVSLGRGIALNVVQVDDLGQDNAVRGGKIVVHQGELELTLLGGQFNFLEVDERTGYLTPWHADPVVGGRVAYRFFDTLLAGAHAVYVMNECSQPWCAGLSGDQDLLLYDDVVWGGGLELPELWGGRLSLAGEVDLQRTLRARGLSRIPLPPSLWQQGDPQEDQAGLAAYGSGTLQLFDLTLLAEFKYYDGFLLQAAKATDENELKYKLVYSQPPTLERITALLSNNYSVSGFRVRLDYNLGELGPVELLLFFNYGYFESWDNDDYGDHVIHDPHGGLELSWMGGEGNFKATAGVRYERNVDEGTVYLGDIHAEASLEQGLVPNHSITLFALWLNRTEYDALKGDLGWNEAELVVGYKWSPHLALAFTYERQEDPKFLKKGSEGNDYFGGSARYYLTSGTYADLRVGQNRPGIKCISGVCREFPAFSGVQLTLVGRLD